MHQNPYYQSKTSTNGGIRVLYLHIPTNKKLKIAFLPACHFVSFCMYVSGPSKSYCPNPEVSLGSKQAHGDGSSHRQTQGGPGGCASTAGQIEVTTGILSVSVSLWNTQVRLSK